MLNEYERERIRRAFQLEIKSIYRIAKEEGYSHQTIEKVLSDALPRPYHLSLPKPALIFGPYQPRVEALLQEREQMPYKQRYTARKIFEILQAEGYCGCVHLDGVLYCVQQLTVSTDPPDVSARRSLNLSDRPDLDAVGNQPVDLSRYEQFRATHAQKAHHRICGQVLPLPQSSPTRAES
jgi:hypothetical protein